MTWLAVAFGGALGSTLRHGVNGLVARLAGSPVPFATAVVNILGSAVIGLLAGLVAGGRLHLSPSARSFVFVGILGGFTTFSSLSLDTLTLVQQGRTIAALSNVAGQIGLGLLGAFLGFAVAG